MDREGMEVEKINKFRQATFGCLIETVYRMKLLILGIQNFEGY